MSDDAPTVLRRSFEGFERGGLEVVARFWHPDIEWRAVEGAADDVGVMTGADALRRYYQDWIETFDDLRAEVIEVIFESGERVAALIYHAGRGRASGVVTDGRYYVVCTIRDGLILRGREYETREQALEAAAQHERRAPRAT